MRGEASRQHGHRREDDIVVVERTGPLRQNEGGENARGGDWEKNVRCGRLESKSIASTKRKTSN